MAAKDFTTSALTEINADRFCSICALAPLAAISSVFGLRVIPDCEKNRNPISQSKCYKMYGILLTCLLWMIAFGITILTPAKLICISWPQMFLTGDYFSYTASIGICNFAAIFTTMMMSKTIPFIPYTQSKVKQRKLISLVNKISILLIIIQIFLYLIAFTVLTATYFPIESRVSGMRMALFCLCSGTLLFCIFIGNVTTVIFSFIIIALTSTEMLKEITLKLRQFIEINKVSSKQITHLISQHMQLQEQLIRVNENWGSILTLSYSFVVIETCLVYYMCIFIEVSPVLYIFHLALAASLTITIILVAIIVARYSLMLYSNFAEIRVINLNSFQLEEKLKVLNFMKRFNGIPLAISLGGYLYVTKEFPVDTYKGFLNTFMTLLKLREIFQDNKCNQSSTLWIPVNNTMN